MNALVDATPISGPARVRKARSDWRTRVLSGAFEIAKVARTPSRAACVRAAMVSAVSPDCEIATVSDRRGRALSRYRYSLAISTLTGIRASDPSQWRATNPLWYEVPHATIVIASISRRIAPALIPNSSGDTILASRV